MESGRVPPDCAEEIRVLVVGCGGIGSRLVQALATIDLRSHGKILKIICIDPSATALDLTRSRLAEANFCPRAVEVKFSQSLGGHGSSIDLLVLATTSSIRHKLYAEAVATYNISKVLFQKFLFTSRNAYTDVRESLRSRGIQGWVHTPRPCWPGYLALAEALRSRGPLSMTVAGSNWAMASNAIHFLAAFNALTGLPAVLDDRKVQLESFPVPNKRAGYLEVLGSLAFQSSRGDRLSLASHAGGTLPISIEVTTSSSRHVVFEGQETIVGQVQEDGWNIRSQPFEILRASEMQKPLSNLLLAGTCELPTFEELVSPHLDLMKVFNRVFFGAGHELDDCPVT